jgi:toxin FitB
MRWLLDSNVFIEGVAGVPQAANVLLKAGVIEWCGFSSMSRLEVFGFPRLTPQDEQRFEILLAQFHEIPITKEIIDAAIRLRRQTKIKTPDAIVAASALVEKAELVTRNASDFLKIPGLIVISPAAI